MSTDKWMYLSIVLWTINLALGIGIVLGWIVFFCIEVS